MFISDLAMFGIGFAIGVAIGLIIVLIYFLRKRKKAKKDAISQPAMAIPQQVIPYQVPQPPAAPRPVSGPYQAPQVQGLDNG